MQDGLEVEAPIEVRVQPEPVAPWPHTVFILAVLGLMLAFRAKFSPVALSTHMSRSQMYLYQMSLTWILTGLTIAGLYRRRQFLAEAFGRERVQVLRDVGRGFLVYLGGMGVAVALGIPLLLTHTLSHKTGVVAGIAPHGARELPLWILVSLTAGVCEELIFRGYLMRQFQRWFGNAWIAVALSGLIFAAMHVYEGSAAVVQVGGLGMFYGFIAMRRGNLRHVMIAHFFQDALTGLFLYLHH